MNNQRQKLHIFIGLTMFVSVLTRPETIENSTQLVKGEKVFDSTHSQITFLQLSNLST